MSSILGSAVEDIHAVALGGEIGAGTLAGEAIGQVGQVGQGGERRSRACRWLNGAAARLAGGRGIRTHGFFLVRVRTLGATRAWRAFGVAVRRRVVATAGDVELSEDIAH